MAAGGPATPRRVIRLLRYLFTIAIGLAGGYWAAKAWSETP